MEGKHALTHKMVHWSLLDDGSSPRLPNHVVMNRSIGRAFTTVAAFFTAATLGAWLHIQQAIDLTSSIVLQAIAVSIFAPIYSNVASRLEHRARVWSRMCGGNRTRALYIFAVTILLVSSWRERQFSRVITNGASVMFLPYPPLLNALGLSLVTFGIAISMTGYVQLGVKGTYMGEAFGFFCPSLLTSFPYSTFDNPMYLGSTLMHLGWALRENSIPDLFVASIVGLSYWVAAGMFESPFTNTRYMFQGRGTTASVKCSELELANTGRTMSMRS
jgi:phosphatidylethanolamine/phosphatidyl-N-methylethanolamine N-methyltransferase